MVSHSLKPMSQMKRRRRDPTTTAFSKLKMQHLRHWCSAAREEWHLNVRMFFKQLASMISARKASLISDKRKKTYFVVASWVKTKLSFALLGSALLCIRGTRHPSHKPIVADTTVIEYETNSININDE